MRTKILTGLLMALFWAAPTVAEDRIIGVLALPQVFGDWPCHDFDPEEITLHQTPELDPPFGMIRIEQHWTFHELGGCEGLRVAVHLDDNSKAFSLPTREFSYEKPGAIVFEDRHPWYRISLAEDSAWLQAKADQFHSIATLLPDSLAYVTAAYSGPMYVQPELSDDNQIAGINLAPGHSLQVLALQAKDSHWWAKVELLDESPCTAPSEPKVQAHGWMPVHATSGEPAIWFHSRGC